MTVTELITKLLVLAIRGHGDAICTFSDHEMGLVVIDGTPHISENESYYIGAYEMAQGKVCEL